MGSATKLVVGQTPDCLCSSSHSATCLPTWPQFPPTAWIPEWLYGRKLFSCSILLYNTKRHFCVWACQPKRQSCKIINCVYLEVLGIAVWETQSREQPNLCSELLTKVSFLKVISKKHIHLHKLFWTFYDWSWQRSLYVIQFLTGSRAKPGKSPY